MAFGSFAKHIRCAQHLSLRSVATRAGVDPAYLSRVEAGTVPPSVRLIEELAPILGCSSDDLALMAGLLPPRVRLALERDDTAPADVVRELALQYATEKKRCRGSAPSTNRQIRHPKSAGMPQPSKRKSERTPTRSPTKLVDKTRAKRSEPTISLDTTTAETRSDRVVHPRNALNALTSTEWIPETISVWTQRGLGAGHEDAKIEREHPAPFSFTDVARLIRFFSKPGERVLDPFVGVGSTLKACALEGRQGIGIDLNHRYVELARKRLLKEVHDDSGFVAEQEVIEGDAREVLARLDANSVDFVVTSPPYWNILHKEDHKARLERKQHDLDTRYGDDPRDLGNLTEYSEFLRDLTGILAECGRILKRKKYMAVVVSDFRDKSNFIMFHADLARSLLPHKLALRGLTVLYQRHKRIFPYGYPYAYVPNIHHQFILILQNDRK